MFLVILRERKDEYAGILFVQVFDDVDEAQECFDYLTNAVFVELADQFTLDLISIVDSTEELLPRIAFNLSTIQAQDTSTEDFLTSLESKKAWSLKLLSIDYIGEEFYAETSSVEGGTRWRFIVEAETPELARKKAIRHIKKSLKPK